MRAKLSYSNVVATLALFIAIGGTSAFAASQLGKNTVGSKQLKKNSVTTAKIKKQAVTAAKVKKGSLTGKQINASTLGTVPSAQTSQTAQTASTVAPAEPWHEVGGQGEPQFQNGCHNATGLPGAGNVRFYKDQIGVVHIEGIFRGCSTEGLTAFQLPSGYLPRPDVNFSQPLFGQEGVVVVRGNSPSNVATNQVGAVSCAVELCILDGITFRAES